jgi:acetylornithine aminotransferase
VLEVTGAGLLLGVVTDIDTAAIAAAALERGFIVNNATPQRVRLAPPLVVSDDDVAALLGAWPAILDAAEAAA